MGIEAAVIITQSTAEAEYVAAFEACMKGQGLINILIEAFFAIRISLRLVSTIKGAYFITTNPTYIRRTRHIELRWHYVRD